MLRELLQQQLLKALFFFIGVYTNAYKINDIIPNNAAHALNIAKNIIPNKLIKPAAITASETVILPAANGRSAVRFISLSVSRSKNLIQGICCTRH